MNRQDTMNDTTNRKAVEVGRDRQAQIGNRG